MTSEKVDSSNECQFHTPLIQKESSANNKLDNSIHRPPQRSKSFRVQLLLGRYIPWFGKIDWQRICFTVSDCLGCLVDGFILALGPFLILIASAIIVALTNCYLSIFRQWTGHWQPLHDIFVAYLLVNVIFNYVMCVYTRSSGSRRGPPKTYGDSNRDKCCLGGRTDSKASNKSYARVVRELADATSFIYPETPAEVEQCKENYQQLLSVRRQAQHQREHERQLRFIEAGEPSSPLPPTARGWMLLGPREWGFCFYTNQPKPPRSHYDHVSKCLVLNLDHYCPWMFNSIGYFNYRYFLNFLCFVFQSMMYGLYLSWTPFWNMDGEQFRQQIILSSQLHGQSHDIHNMIPWVPTPYQRTPLAFCFMICLSVGIAILGLFGFHLYLTLTAQTTIEFHANVRKRRDARDRGVSFINPYDLGYKRNWQQVYGLKRQWLLSVLIPSFREPEFLPLPLADDLGRGHAKKNENGFAEVSTRLVSGGTTTQPRRKHCHDEENPSINSEINA